MSNTAIIELIHNTALLLALVLLFDMVFRNQTWKKTILNQILIGVVIGFIGLLIMVSPMTFIPGVVFDTRSILLGIAGLFFGTIPTLAAMLITAAYRAYQGGAGALMGVLVIFSTGTIGILWRQKRKGLIAAIRPLELYFFGVVIHIVMMLLALTLPPDTARRILANLTLPVIVIYPVGTMLLGLLFIMRMRREIQAENVAESETRYKIVAENPYDWEYWLGTDGQYKYCSPSCLPITGYTAQEVMEDPQIIWRFIHPDDIEMYKKHRETAAEEKKGQQVDMRIIRKDGKVRWIGHICRPVYGENGEYLGTRGSNRDITDEKIATNLLQENEEKYRTLTEEISDVLWVMDANTGRFTYLSPSVEKLRGYTVEEIMAQPVTESLVPEYREEFIRMTESLVEGVLAGKISSEAEYTNEVSQPCKDGSIVITEVKTIFYINDETGHVEVRGVSRNITERKTAEEAMRNSEEKYRLVVENQRDLIARTNNKGIYTYANPAFCQFFDKTEEELIGNIFNPEVHPGDQDRVIKAFRSLGTPPHEFTMDQRVKSNGKWIYTNWTMRAIVNDDGQISSIIASGRDISERKHAELEIQTAQSELKRLLEESDESRQVLLSMLEDQKIAEEALQEEQYLMNSLMETVPDTIYFKDISGRFIRVNKAQADLLGATDPQDLLGKTDFDFFDNRHATIARAQEVKIIENGIPIVNQEELLTFYSNDRTDQWVTTTKMPLYNQNHVVIGIYGVTRDISNIKDAEKELQTAYDATLQGWAAALELREKETAAHSRNVVDMTLKLAREFDIPDQDMVHVRRGALLHDIGKMGIPDDILLKPGKLTDEEWVIMKMHPIFAFELLSDIPYLQPALDIPYAHHERWDGSGYPLGLKETNIPLVARIFAVVDVWDALSSDRPYRPAWNKKAVHDYLREKSGSQFDPQVVEAFLNILSYEVDVPGERTATVNLNYALALGFSAAISGLLTLVVINKRSSAGAPGLALTMVAMFIWSSTYAIHWSVTTPQIRNFWLDMTYFGALLAPTALLIFALQYTNRADVLTRRNIAILSVEPLFILVLLWTDPLFNLFYAGLRTVDSIHQGGPGFWFNLIYSYAVIGTAILYLIRYMNKKGKTVRNGVLLVIAAMLLPSVGPIIGILKFPFLTDLDTTPFLFLASSILIYFSMIHFRLLDLAPTAHSKLIETLQDAMIVLDENRNILEINPAASLLFGSRAIQPGREMQEVFDDQPVLLDAIKTGQNHSLIIQLDNGNPHIYEVTISTLNNRFQHLNGWLILFHDITVYKQTEAALTQSENRLNSLFSSMTDVILILDKDGRYLEIAPTNPNNLARDPFNLMGKTVFDIFPEEDANLFLETIAKALETRQMVRVDYSMIIEGRQVWFAGNVSPLDENSVTWVARDITERKKAEEEIRESENKLRALFSAMTDVILVLDSEGRYLEIAPTSTKSLYLTPPEIIGRTVKELLPEEPANAIIQGINQSLASGENYNLNYNLNIEDEPRWFSSTISRLTANTVTLVAHDITDLKITLNSLSIQEEQYTDLINNLNEGICIVDLVENFTFTNPTANVIFGLHESTLVGRNISEFVDAETFDFLKDQTKERKENKSGRYELKIKRPDGEYRYLQVSPRPQLNKAGSIIGTFAVFRDFTENRMAQQALLESETRLNLAQRLAHVGNYEWDVATRKMWASEETFQILGMEQISPFISFFDVLKLIVKEDRAKFTNIMRDMMLDVPVRVDEFRIIRKGETEPRILQGIAQKILDADGNVLKLSGVLQDITSIKQTEYALEKRVLALTRPLESGEGITFDDLFNLDEIQQLQDEFANAIGVGSLITLPDGTPLTRPSNFCVLCNDIIRGTEKGQLNCQKSDAIIGQANADGPRVQPCMSGGLWDAGAAITVGGHHIANWLIGQVRDETQSEEKIRAYARQIGADEDAAARAFLDVPPMSKARFEQISQTLFTLANQLSTMAFQNIQQARFISERQQAENALQNSENKLRKIFSSMSDIIIIYDKDGRYVEIAPTNTGKLYRPPEELLNYTISEIFDPETASLFMRSIHTTLEKGSPQQVDYKLNIRGEDFWFTSSVSPLSDSQVIWVARDITDRKKAEEEINKFKLWVERSNDVIFMTDIQGSITFANEAFERVYGYTLDETLGQTPRIIKSGLISQEEYKGFWQTLLNKGVITGEMINKTKDGRMIPVEGSNNPILNSEGEIIGFIAVHHDISERKKAEEAMTLQSTALNAAANGIVISDRDGIIEWVNPAFTRDLEPGDKFAFQLDLLIFRFTFIFQ